MQVNNNNQTSFGMKKVTAQGFSRRMEKLIAKTEQEALQIGHVAADCVITPAKGYRNVSVQVGIGNGKDCLGGEAVGRVFSRKGLLKLIHRANNKLNQIFIDFRLRANPTKEDLVFELTDDFLIAGDKEKGLKALGEHCLGQTKEAMPTDSTKIIH